MTNPLAAQLRALDTEGTPALWTGELRDCYLAETTNGKTILEIWSEGEHEQADLELIVTLRNNTPEIVAALEAVERVRSVAEGYRFNGRGQPDDLPDEHQIIADEVACAILRALDGE